MKKFIKLFLSLSLMINFVAPSKVKANEELNNRNITILASDTSTENFDVKVEFIDESLLANNSVNTRGAIVPEYSHSYYTYSHRTITEYYYGPRHNDVFLVTVARGETKSIGEAKTVSGSIVFQGNVNSKIKEIINLGLGLTISGVYSKTYSSSTSFTLDSNASCNSRSFYTAIDYDLSTVYVKRYDVYNYVDQTSGIISGTESLYHSTIATSNVKVPRESAYSIDHTY